MKSPNEKPSFNLNGEQESATSQFIEESKKKASELYEEGMNKAAEVGESVKEYSDRVLIKVQENPLTSILIAGGIGFLLSRLMKK